MISEYKYSMFFSDKRIQENVLNLKDNTYEHGYILKLENIPLKTQ